MWCNELLRDMLGKKQVRIVPSCSLPDQPLVTPRKSLIKKLAPVRTTGHKLPSAQGLTPVEDVPKIGVM